MASISRALQRIKEDLRPFLPDESIRQACRDAGHKWRQRLLDPVTTVHLFVLQVLNFNTAVTGLRHLAKWHVNAAAYCEARKRLPLAALQALLRSSSAAMRGGAAAAAGPAGLWHGLRALLVDGSGAILPDVPALQEAFGQPKGQKAGCGFPMAKVLGLFDAFTGLVVEVLPFPLYTHEQSKVSLLHPLLGEGDLLVGDRGFCSYVHLAMLSVRKVRALFRMHQRQIVDFRPRRKARPRNRKHKKGRDQGRPGSGRPSSTWVRRLGKHDQVVRWYKPASKPKWMGREQYKELPESLLVREIRYRIPRKGQRTLCVTVATTLLDPALYPKQEVAKLYNARWAAETHFGELKTTLKMRKLKCKTVDGVKKELAVYALVYNLARVLMAEAARRQETTPGRISFLDTVRWLINAEPGEQLPRLIVNPLRPDRHEPRVIKDRQDRYKVMNKPRGELRKALRKQAVPA